MTCEDCLQCEERLQPYLDRVLSVQERAWVQLHIEACGQCARCYRLEETFRRYVKKCCGEEQMTDELKGRLLALRTPLH
jgi:mycothiol system anti-sigma-R factor